MPPFLSSCCPPGGRAPLRAGLAWLTAAVTALTALTALTATPPARAATGPPAAVLRARAGLRPAAVVIRRTEFGLPHILAASYRGLGYGYGYAFAQDNLCTLAAQVLTLRGERSRYFGPRADS